MRQRAPHVDAVFGTRELLRSAISWRHGRSTRSRRMHLAPTTQRILLRALGGTPDGVIDAFSHLRAFVTVQRGCSYYCTFCIVPHVRGRFDHRPCHVILSEARERIVRGAREIMLVGQTVNAWRDPADGADFGDLCSSGRAIAGLERLTFTSHPKDFTEKIARELAAFRN